MIAFNLDLCAQALHEFFQDQRLRCYLKNIMGKRQKKNDKCEGFNLLFLRILNLHGFENVDRDALDFWNAHRAKFKKNYMLETIATSANRDKGIYDKDCLKISQIPDLIDAAFKDFESPSTIFQRHVKFDNTMPLSNFFNALFIDIDLSVLKKLVTAWIHTAPEASSSVPGNDAFDSVTMTVDEGRSMNIDDDDNCNDNGQMETDNVLQIKDGMENDENGNDNGHDMDLMNDCVEDLNEDDHRVDDVNGVDFMGDDSMNDVNDAIIMREI